ncbi:RING finger domain-containing protein [Melanomma pulvis-pyrius CBS 109.77]|uniref:E3 ubiquitin-protein ligase n=1 Tax=Melanomma pulvis-pyrius CBS 109.77 TaxID=1314802 RepID=A0A6A6XK05_9PLEO|nr:RING finger domain-containing protein [Melanomma pulvis-pyrius CBS 109.77]
MLISLQEQELCRHLRDLPRRHDYVYTEQAARELHQILFRSLAGRGDYLPLLFPQGPPVGTDAVWSLRDAQGAVEGAEYTAAARGKPCGHIFKSGEATYRCKTCTADDTCVLCARCFDASDHDGHQVFVSVSPGNSGCCDCGDDEAWVRPVHCNIHSASQLPGSKSAGKAKKGSSLPDELLESIRMTIARALDYLIDVFSCSPEQLRLPKTEESILEDERTSRLTSKWYGPGDIPEADQKFTLVLWNDEKHTVYDVRDQVARACKQKLAFGLAKAHEVDDIGRSTIVYRSDIKELLRMAKIIEDIKLTVTIRSARDTFREQMGGAIIDWISDISGCSVGDDSQVLRRTVCEELLKPWRIGSEASHQSIGKDGLDDHEFDDKEAEMNGYLTQYMNAQRRAQVQRLRRERANNATINVHVTAWEEDEDVEAESAGDAGDDMDIDDILDQDNDGDVDMEAYESPDEALEVSEATIAGYPPPPLPPQPGPRRNDPNLTPTESDSEPMLAVPMLAVPPLNHVEPSMHVPETPQTRLLPLRHSRPPKHWLEKPDSYGKKPGTPAHEDLWVRLRLDHLILYDLRMWKKLRIGVRDVFISTVVTIPQFKRLLGLRFAGVYTALAQLYLIADREPDHSIINLSLQMLTTPSITAEVVERGNFLTNLMAILYTFLTTRQVGYPWNVDYWATLAFEQGAVTNRRMYHFFLDMKYLLGSEHVQERIREDERYLLQFLDLVKLHQGICPNVRAVGEHLEYETEAWISASLITREINKLCRQFSDSFKWNRDDDPTNICRAIRSAAKVAIINSLGSERKRFDQAELKSDTRFKSLEVLEFDAQPSTYEGPSYKIVDYVVAKEHMSFHHALHYTLSWLIDRARSMPRDHLRELLLFAGSELENSFPKTGTPIPQYQPDEYLLALFDFPLRVCAWLAQMRAGIWVRNGITLRHQMTQYRSVSQRDVSYQRDIFLLQTALVICNPSVFLATMVDRFGLMGWMTGKYDASQHGFEESQAIDVVEDFVHLLIMLLSDRTSLIPPEDDVTPQIAAMRRDIAHILCFKPLPFSEMTTRLSDRVQNMDEFSDVLEEMTTFKSPEGLSDTGTFELKEEYIQMIDPYIHQFTRNQREEAETIYKTYMAKKTGKPVGDIIFEPQLRPITSGLFESLSEFTRQPFFTQIIYYLLGYALVAPATMPNLPATRIETYVQFVLQLVLVAVLEDKSEQHEWSQDAPESFATSVLRKHANFGISGHPTILSILKALLEKEAFKSCEPKITLILHRLKQRQQSIYIIASEALNMSNVRIDTASPAAFTLQEKELKKKQALERQARVMASFKEQQGKFLANQDFDWGEEDFSDLDNEAGVPAAELETVIKYPSGTCILCQEETNEQRLYGTFGYVSESSILRQTDLKDDDWVDEATQTPISLDRSAESIRPFGVASKNRRTVEKISSTGEKILTERQDLGKGFPRTQTRRGPVTTGCGHIMHYSCFEVYLQATQRRHVSQIARNHPERPDMKEFMCPLCKALGNMFLPIIWKGKKVKYPGALESQTSFDDWIGSEVALSISKFDKSPERASREHPANHGRQQKALFDYGLQNFIQPVASRLPEIVKSNFVTMPVPQPSTQHRFQIPAFLHIQNDEPREPVVLPPENNSSTVQTFQMLELVRIYQRLRDTFRVNKIHSVFDAQHTASTPVEDLTQTDSLARALGYSVSAVEIAQRGVQSDSMRGTLIDKISPQSLTHLRVFSETVSSYVAIGGLKDQGLTKTMEEQSTSQSRQLHQLLIGHPNLFDPHTLPYELKGIEPLILQDPFIFLSECAACIVPALGLDIHHVLRLCYLAEMVRVVLAFSADSIGRHQEATADIKLEGISLSDEASAAHGRFRDPGRFINVEKVNNGTFDVDQMNNLLLFICLIFNVASSGDSPASIDIETMPVPARFRDPKFLYHMYTMVSTYALPFVRKAAILMHVRYGVELPHTPFETVDESELDRLSSLLKLPSLHEMFASFGTRSAGGYATRLVVGGWIRHWIWTREGKRPLQPSISLSHPAIFELVGLPKNYDTLTDEAIRRKCPTTGKELTDPCVCLFCGEIMCSQGVCCMTERNRGGCNQHQAKCGGNIGLYINIRKCMVLFLNLNNGTWAVAPYLDKHGEADPTLRRHHQLYLNQKRYDVLLRKVWLEGSIQSLIARRLEGDINNGGWETL